MTENGGSYTVRSFKLCTRSNVVVRKTKSKSKKCMWLVVGVGEMSTAGSKSNGNVKPIDHEYFLSVWKRGIMLTDFIAKYHQYTTIEYQL